MFGSNAFGWAYPAQGYGGAAQAVAEAAQPSAWRRQQITALGALVAPAAVLAGTGRVQQRVAGRGHTIPAAARFEARGAQSFERLDEEELLAMMEVFDGGTTRKPGDPGAGPLAPNAGGGAPAGAQAVGVRGAARAEGEDRGASAGAAAGREAALPGLLSPGGPGHARRDRGLTERQAQVLTLIEEATRVLGEAPSARAIARRLGVHHSRVQQILEVLYRKGRLATPSPAGLRRTA